LGLHPLNQQCEAKAKATGRRCERRVVGGTVCFVHGGNAKQVKAKREQRVALADAQAAVPASVVLQKEPEELLLDALHDVNQVLQQLKSELHGGSVNPILLNLAGEWLDRLGRLGKVVTDGDLATKLHARKGWLAQDRSQQLWGHLAAIVEASPLSAQQKSALWQSRFDGLRAIGDGRAPFRLSGDELHRFSDGLMEAAAREQEAAEGITWGEVSSESESDVGELVLFPSHGDGLVS
jgi:hypothetical protein